MARTLDDLFASPDHYLHSFKGDAAIFVRMDRAAYHRSIFLDGRIATAADGRIPVPIAALVDGLRPAAPTGWIFHMAHCGSTLLARALDDPAGNLILREPRALRQLALSPDAWRLTMTIAMLSKRYRVDAPTVVKANVPVNFLLPDLVARDPKARAIFLYFPLRDYLLAILRDDSHREWLHFVTLELAAHLGDTTHLSDAERAAALWLAQMRAFAAAIAAMPNARALEAERFFTAPRPTLQAAAQHLEISMTRAAIDATVSGPLFATYSKSPGQAFDNAKRVARRNILEKWLEGELAQAQRWVEQTASDTIAEIDILAAAGLD
ncbi:MAG: hypothetical protein ABIS51_03465 [Sphingomonas sp.]